MSALVERDDEIEALRALMDRARMGQGAVAVVEGSAGLGKTALLRRLRDELDEDEVTVVSARAGELEREFPFGLVRQLFEPLVLRADPERRERLLGGAAALAAPVVGAAPETADASADAAFATLHGLYWLVAALAEERPLVLFVDDAHWGDAPSLRSLDFLARRPRRLRDDGRQPAAAARAAAHARHQRRRPHGGGGARGGAVLGHALGGAPTAWAGRRDAPARTRAGGARRRP